MSQSAASKVQSFPSVISKPILPRDKVTEEIRTMLKSDSIPPKGDPTRADVIKERRAYYKNMLAADTPSLRETDWAVIFVNTDLMP